MCYRYSVVEFACSLKVPFRIPVHKVLKMRYHRVYTGRKLNVHRTCLNVYVRSIYVLCLQGGIPSSNLFVAAVPLKKYLLNSKKKKKKIQILFFFFSSLLRRHCGTINIYFKWMLIVPQCLLSYSFKSTGTLIFIFAVTVRYLCFSHNLDIVTSVWQNQCYKARGNLILGKF